MKNRLFILVLLSIFLFPVIVSAQSVYWERDFNLSNIGNHEKYETTISKNVLVEGRIKILPSSGEEALISFLIFNEEEYERFDETVCPFNATYNATPDFQILNISHGDVINWNHNIFAGNGSLWYFVWLKVVEDEIVTSVNAIIEIDSASITITTNTTTTTTPTTTTTTSGTTITTTDRIENNLLIYLLLGVLGGIGVIVIYMVVRPRKIKYVWDVK